MITGDIAFGELLDHIEVAGIEIGEGEDRVGEHGNGEQVHH